MHFAIFEKRGNQGINLLFSLQRKLPLFTLRNMGVFVVVVAKEWELVNYSVVCWVGRPRCDYPCNIRLQLTFFFDKPLEHFACLIISKDHVVDREAMSDVRDAVACSATSEAIFSRKTCSSASAVSVMANRIKKSPLQMIKALPLLLDLSISVSSNCQHSPRYNGQYNRLCKPMRVAYPGRL